MALALLCSGHTVLADPAALCEQATRRAAAATGAPEHVLHAIALTETGRKREGGLRAWPWAINHAGRGMWFDSREEALAQIRAILATGAENVDIGCFQINHRWHGAAFASPDAMIEPGANALYAARFLARLHAETGDWTAAAGAYHSRTPHHAARYIERFTAHLGGPPPGPPGPPPGGSPRVNAYPLLQVGGAGSAGSLFRAPVAQGRGLIGLRARPLFGEG